MKRLDSIQLGRAAAVLSVLFLHLLGLSAEYQHGCFAYPWIGVLRAGVDIFFVISGVVMVVTTSRNLEKPGTAKRFIIHRVSRIYPPYLILTVALWLLWLVRPQAVNAKIGVNLLTSFTLWPSVKGFPLVQVGWTLSYEMMFYLVFFLMVIYARRRLLPRALALWSVAVMLGRAAILLDSSGTLVRDFPRAPFLFNPYVLEFVAGCFIGLYSQKIKLVAGRISVLAASAIFVLEATLLQVNNFDESRLHAFRVLLFGPPAVLLVYGLLAWDGEGSRLRAPRWAIRCGDISYSIYLVHLLLVHFAYRYLWTLLNHAGGHLLFLAATTGAAIAASGMFYKLIERPSCRWTRTLLERIFEVPTKATIGPSSVSQRRPSDVDDGRRQFPPTPASGMPLIVTQSDTAISLNAVKFDGGH